MSDRIITKPSTAAYREGWDRAFGKERVVFNTQTIKATPDQQRRLDSMLVRSSQKISKDMKTTHDIIKANILNTKKQVSNAR